MTTEPVMAWHFVGDTLRDGQPVPADGEWLVHEGPLVLCESGLHASIDPFDALTYTPGSTLCLVEMAGPIVYGDDKLVAARRRIVTRRDMTDPLRLFARQCASDVLHLWEAPEVVRRYLETGDTAIQADAAAAAWAAAAWAAARAAAAAARATGRDTARVAAYAASAAVSAAYTAEAAAEAAHATRAAQRRRWAGMVAELFDHD